MLGGCMRIFMTIILMSLKTLEGLKVAHADEECESQTTTNFVDSGEQDATTKGDQTTEVRDDETMKEADENEERGRQQPQPIEIPFKPVINFTRKRKAQEVAPITDKEKENVETVVIENESEEAPVTDKEKDNVEAVQIENAGESEEAVEGQQSQPMEKGSKVGYANEECEGQTTVTFVDFGEQDATTEGDQTTEARDDETMKEANENEERDCQQPQAIDIPFKLVLYFTRKRKVQEAAHVTDKEKEYVEAVSIEKESEEALVTDKEKENVEAV